MGRRWTSQSTRKWLTTLRRPTSGSRRRNQKRSVRTRPQFPHKKTFCQSIATTSMWLSYHKILGQSWVSDITFATSAHFNVNIIGSAYSNVSSAHSNVNIVRTILPFLYDILPESSLFHRILPFDLCPSFALSI